MGATHTSTFTTSDGCEIAYTLRATTAGRRGRLALIHSLALDASLWDGVVARLAGQFDLLTYDCRGHGHSSRHGSDYTSDLFARDLCELLDQVGWRTACIAGCSMGGNVAQAVAGRYPARVSALGLVDTTAWYGKDAPDTWRDRVATARAKGLGSLVDFQLGRWFSERFLAAEPETVGALKEVFLANDLDAYAASCSLLGKTDSRPYLASLGMPVAIIVGEEDYATPVTSARQLHESIAGSTLTIIPGARHLTPVEYPDDIAAALLTLSGRAPAPAAER